MQTWQSGDLVQIKRGVTGMGDVGMVVGPSVAFYMNSSATLLAVLFSDGMRSVHPGNLQKPDGRTRKELVDEELRKALEALPESTRFNVIPYTATAVPWQKSLVPAERKNVAKALEWFVGRKDTGTGDLWGALQLALADPAVDTLVVLSDGAPSGGRRWNLGLMKQLFAEQNRFRRVELDAVLADASGWLAREWDEMCAATGGRTLQIQLR